MRRFWANVFVYCSTVIPLVGFALPQQSSNFEWLLASAQQAQARGDFESAARFYKEASSIHPELAEIRANLGLMYFQTGNYGDAAEVFRQAIRLSPELLVPNLFLGLSELRLKRFDKAIPYLRRAALLKPTEVQAHLGLAEAYAATGKTQLVINSYLRAIQLDLKNADAWYHLGVSYLAQAEADSRILVVRYKESAFFQVLAAETLLEQRSFSQAEEAYKNALGFSRFPEGTHGEYGFLLLYRHELADAEREFRMELASDPGSLMGKLGMARLQLEQRADFQSASELKQIYEIDSGFLRSSAAWLKRDLSQQNSSELQQSLMEKYGTLDSAHEIAGILAGGNSERHSRAFQPATASLVENSPSFSRPIRREAAGLHAAGRYRQCTEILAPQLQLLKSEQLRLLASCAYFTGDYLQAFEAGSKLARNASTEPEGLYWKITSAQRLATETLARASELDSRSPELHILLGDVYRQRKLFADAEKEYRSALTLQPDDAGALFGLSLALLGDGRTDEAFDVAKAPLRSNPDDPELNAVMGEILCARQDYSAAEPYLKKSLNTKPEYVSHVHALLGKVYAHTDRTEQAIKELKLALANDKDGSIHYQIARLYLKVGDRNAADQAFAVSEQIQRERVGRDVIAMQRDENDQ